jgi:hypothetical protein
MLLLGSITDFIETRRLVGLRITLHTIRAHINIRGNDLVDAAAKLAVTHFNTFPPPQTLRVEIVETAPRPIHWVMYSAKLTGLLRPTGKMMSLAHPFVRDIFHFHISFIYLSINLYISIDLSIHLSIFGTVRPTAAGQISGGLFPRTI